MAALRIQQRELVQGSFRLPSAPLLWFDTTQGLSADLSTWTARYGSYTATQSTNSKRFTRVADDHPNWLGVSTTQSMSIPNVALSQAPAMSVLMAANVTNVAANYGQGLLQYPNGQLYTYQSGAEFFITEGSGGSNPVAAATSNQFAIYGGDAVVGRSPSSRSYYNKNLQYKYNRSGNLAALLDGTWTVSADSGGYDGRLRHVLVFNYLLTDAQRTAWVDYLLATPN